MNETPPPQVYTSSNPSGKSDLIRASNLTVAQIDKRLLIRQLEESDCVAIYIRRDELASLIHQMEFYQQRNPTDQLVATLGAHLLEELIQLQHETWPQKSEQPTANNA
jgi:hypothetical protein